LTEHAFDVSKDGGVMNQTVEATKTPEQTAELAAEKTPEQNKGEATDSASDPTNGSTAVLASGLSPAESASSPASPLESSTTDSLGESTSDSSATEDTQDTQDTLGTQDPLDTQPLASNAEQSPSMAPTTAQLPSSPRPNEPSPSDANADSVAMEAADSSSKDVEAAKKPRASRTPKAPAKPVEAAGSIITIVERVVRMTALSEEHGAALARLFNVSLPDDYIARLTRLTGASLGPIGSGAAEALTIVLGLESANPIHVGVQLGRLAATSLPDVYRCAHALTGETAPALPKGDNAVFAVADVLATLTADDFALARALSSALE
jgi:hypothetical protein